MQVAVTITHVEMLQAPERRDEEGLRLEVRQVVHPVPSLNRYFYRTVGAAWTWHSCRPWSLRRWADLVTRPGFETWIGYLDDGPAGYFELDAAGTPGEVEIVHFGLLPEFIGRGLGREFLAAAIDRAWAIPGTERVQLNTCTLDHPRALPNYLAAGFRVARVEEVIDDVPDEPLEP